MIVIQQKMRNMPDPRWLFDSNNCSIWWCTSWIKIRIPIKVWRFFRMHWGGQGKSVNAEGK